MQLHGVSDKNILVFMKTYISKAKIHKLAMEVNVQ